MRDTSIDMVEKLEVEVEHYLAVIIDLTVSLNPQTWQWENREAIRDRPSLEEICEIPL